jgi:hypothetical protein
MTQFFRQSLIIECTLNILGAVTFLLYPEWCLSHAVSTNDVPHSAIVLWQIYAVLVLELTLGLILCIPNSPGVAEKRKLLFQILGAGEVVLIGLLLWWAGKGPDASGFASIALLLSAASLVPLVTWKGFVLMVVPEMMEEEGAEKKGQ